MIMKLLGLGGGALGLPAIGGMVVAGLVALSALTFTLVNAWENHKTGLRNEGAQQCMSAVNTAEHTKLQGDYSNLLARFSQLQKDQLALTRQRDVDKAEASTQHQQVTLVMKADTCKVSDAAIDAVNAPLRPIKTGSMK